MTLQLITAADLDEPYASRPNAEQAAASASAQVVGAVGSSPLGYTLPSVVDDLPDVDRQLLVGWARAIAHLELTSGRAGAAAHVVQLAASARSGIEALRTGKQRLGLARAAEGGVGVVVVGPARANLLARLRLLP